MRTFDSIADLTAAQGQTIGQSDWVTITQEDVNLFADATGDHQLIRRCAFCSPLLRWKR